METDILIAIIVFGLVIFGITYYDITTTVPGEFQTVTEKISDEVGSGCTLYKTYQFCEEDKRCGGDKKMERPVYSTVCEDGRAKTTEHITEKCGKNCTKTFTEEVTTTHNFNP
ncbi:hypothetical protein BLM37_03250 [Candidatus Gracilibacteria bacterium GN02-873]|nr:hypothetical protein BLM37_03250 [Candidatus Gracilibacteria bacterium GN02-873]